LPSNKPPFSECDVPQDSGTNRIETGYEHQSSGIDTVSKRSIQISSHDSTKNSEEHILRRSAQKLSSSNERLTDDKLNRGCEEVDSSVLVQVSSAPAEIIGTPTPAPAPCRAVENTQKSSLASNDLRNSSLHEDALMMGQTSSLVTDLKGGSCGHIVGTDLPTQSSSYVATTSALCLPIDIIQYSKCSRRARQSACPGFRVRRRLPSTGDGERGHAQIEVLFQYRRESQAIRKYHRVECWWPIGCRY
jgi:hypothetical protein